MCACEEIQKDWKEKQGDYWRFPNIDTLYITPTDMPDSLFSDADKIWLPRQDQLQEMMKYKYRDISKKYNDLSDRLIFGFNDFINRGFPFIEFGHSIEGLCLMWFMLEKHSKQWNGDKWVKIKHGKPTD